MKAAVAIAHKILVSVWHMLTDGSFYQDLEPDTWTRWIARETRDIWSGAWRTWGSTSNSPKRLPERAEGPAGPTASGSIHMTGPLPLAEVQDWDAKSGPMSLLVGVRSPASSPV
jgi:hypothetical protein